MALKTTREVAVSLRLAEGTLANWRSQGRGPAFVRVGGKICYRDEDIDAFIERGVCQSTSEPRPDSAEIMTVVIPNKQNGVEWLK